MSDGQPELNAANLKNVLWQTIADVREGKLSASDAQAVANQAKQILAVVKTQIDLAKLLNDTGPDALPQGAVYFTESDD